MSQVLFDTQSAVDDLKRGGFSEEQAKANVPFVREALEGGVATKGDIEKLDARMDTLEVAIRAEMKVLRFQILAALTGATGFLEALRVFI